MLEKDNSKEEIKKEIKKLEKIIEDNDSSKKEKAEAYKKIITIYPEISDEMYPVKAFIKEVPYGKPGANRKKSRKPLEMGGLLQDDKKRMGYEEGGSIDNQMMMVMETPQESEIEPEMPMESDDNMEDGYTRFIMDEALSEEEEDMLMSKLEQDEELAMIFDKVIDVAQEFAGSGPVEGPGSGVSDSIPARLSDGEFVFTAKAVEEIGADNLMSMMKDAEAKADERQPLQNGGTPRLKEETMATKTPMTEQVIRVERGPQTEQVGVGGSILDQVREEDNPLYDEMPFKRPPVHGAGYGR